MRAPVSILIFTLFLLFACSEQDRSAFKEGPYENKIDSLLGLMTLDEKAGQLTLYTAGYAMTGTDFKEDFIEEVKAGRAGNILNAWTTEFARPMQELAMNESRLKIPMLFGLDVIHGYRTTYPIPLGEACTWDMEIIERTAKLSAKEAASGGVNWTYNPMVDIARDPRWGRIAEGSGEDPYLGSLIAAAKVRGYQGDDLSSQETILACVKHFAAYGASQAGRDYHTVDMSDRMLREQYLPPYRAAIEAGAATVMTAFNEFDGVPATGSTFLLTDILRNEWNFEGFIVTDYTSINEMIPHGYARDEEHAAELAFKAGVDMDMQGGLYSKHLPDLVRKGAIREQELDRSVRRILRMKYELGLFDDPFRYLDSVRESETYYSAEFFEHALSSAKESIVLLKNENELLPLDKGIGSVALIGPLADDQRSQLGAWYVAGNPEKVVTLKQGIEKVSPGVKIHYAKGADFKGKDRSGFAEAISAARKSDLILMALGETHSQSGEASSRTDIGLPGVQQELLEEVYKLGKPVILIAMAGRPLTITWADEHIPAILNTWHLGTMAGEAIAQTLFGGNNPSGKLTVTFPRNVGQIPIHYNMKNTGRPFDPENYFTTKYIDSPNDPLYPFGFGLSYSTFTYSDLQLSANEMTKQGSISISVSVKNTGKYEGEEVVQLYLRDLVGSVTRPVKELKGFQKISLAAGEEKTVTFEIRNEDLVFYTYDKTWESEPGDFIVYVGTNSMECLEAPFRLVNE